MGKPRRKVSSAAVVARKKKKADGGEVSSNPFEVRVNRRKHDVLGQKMRSGRGLPGVARSRGIQKRKKTLLQEYRSRHRTGVFLDRRFGENNLQLSTEEKVAQRFFLEKKKRHGRFNLGDEDTNEEGLTHFGQSLGDMEKFDEVQLSDGGEEEGDIGETHFGGFLKKKKTSAEDQESETAPKSRNEVMKELVAKSKQMKYERQSVRREAEDLMDTLDSQWKDLQGLLTHPTTESSVSSAGPPTTTTSAAGASTDYDRVVRELALERRAQATDRLKTAEELAGEERDRLVKLEAERVKRMRGEERAPVDKEMTVHISADAMPTRSERKKDVRFMLCYEDGVMVRPVTGEGSVGDVEETEQEEEEEVEEEEGEEEKEEEEEEGEDSCDPAEEFGSDLESDGYGEDKDELTSEEEEEEEEEEGGGEVEGVISGTRLSERQREAVEELPYTFNMPTSLPELLALTTGRSPEECGTVIERIHSCYHPSLAPENRHLLERFLDLLVSYCRHLGKEATHNGWQTLNCVASSLLTLALVNPPHTARVFRRHLTSVHKSWKSSVRRTLPQFDHVVVFWLVGVVFPTSDFKHPITTPAMMIMGQILLKSSVKTASDLLVGLSLCDILLSMFISSSKRFIPELVNFLTSCTALISIQPNTVFFPPFSTKTLCLNSSVCKSLNKWPPSSHPPTLLSALQLSMEERGKDGEAGGEYPAIIVGAITSCLRLTARLCEIYKNLPSFAEVFSGIKCNLSCVSPELSKPMQELVREVLESVSTPASVPRPVLQLLKKKPKSIKFYEPSFDNVYDVRKRKAPSRSANEKQKLRHKVKMERKGAIRELKKDTHFLSREKIRESRERDAEREKKTRQIVHDLQNIQHEAKMERLTSRRKR